MCTYICANVAGGSHLDCHLLHGAAHWHRAARRRQVMQSPNTAFTKPVKGFLPRASHAIEQGCIESPPQRVDLRFTRARKVHVWHTVTGLSVLHRGDIAAPKTSWMCTSLFRRITAVDSAPSLVRRPHRILPCSRHLIVAVRPSKAQLAAMVDA